MRYLLAITFFLTTLGSNAQCLYQWKIYYTDGNIKDTSSSSMQFFEDSLAKIERIDFDALIKQIRVPRLPPELIARRVESIRKLTEINTDSAKKEIDFINYELESHFQILRIGEGVECALYSIDTVKDENRLITVYTFSTDMRGEWNEDFDNYRFYYTPEYGVLYADHTSIWGYFYPVSVILTDNCRLNGKKVDVKAILEQCEGAFLWKD